MAQQHEAGDTFSCEGRVLRCLPDGRCEVEIAGTLTATVSLEEMRGLKKAPKSKRGGDAEDATDSPAAKARAK
jgi:hypothetical protein